MTKNLIVPSVFEITSDGVRSYDIFSKLLEERIVFLNGEVNEVSGNLVTAQLLYLESIDNKAPIYLYINSPGGSCSDGLQIIDTMNFITCPVATVVTGMACSMGFAILTAGEPGMRYALPHAEIMAHMVSSGSHGHIKDMEISFEQSNKINILLSSIISENIGMDVKKYNKKVDRDLWLTSEEALKFGSKGIVDKVIKNRSEL